MYVLEIMLYEDLWAGVCGMHEQEHPQFTVRCDC